MIRKAKQGDLNSIYKLIKLGSEDGQVLLRSKKELKNVYEVLSITDKIEFFNRFGFFNQLSGQSPLFKKLKKR